MVRMVGKTSKNRLVSFIVIIMVVALVISGCGSNTASKDGVKSIKVGIIDSYTGGAVTYTQDALDGFKLAVKEIEAQGGPKIEFVTRDDEFKADKAASWAKELVMREQVDFLAGTINSAGSLAVSQHAKESKVPFIVWGGMSNKITGEAGHRYVFSALPNTAVIGKAGAAQLSNTEYKRYWLAGSDYEYGHSVIDNLWGNLTKMKPDVQKVDESWWRVGETDFTPYINAIRSAKPEVLVVGTGGADMVAFMKALKATGLPQEMKVWVHTALDVSTLRPLGDQAPEGVLGTNPYLYYYPDTDANKAFVETFKKEYNREPASFALYGYMSGKLLGAAIEKAGSSDKEKIIDALEGLSIDTPVGKATMRAEDHQIMIPMTYGVVAKENGQIKATELNTLQAEDIMPSTEEVLKSREKK